MTGYTRRGFLKAAGAAGCLAHGALAFGADERPTGGNNGPRPETPIGWAEIEKFFVPPAEFQGKFGPYRSVMRLDDGGEVRKPEDWPRRRQEILKYWHGVMGPWPAPIDRPRIKYKAKQRVESFTRHAVEVEVAPGRLIGTQYLLVPDGAGPFPGVVVTWYNSEDSAGMTAKYRGVVDFGHQLARRGFVALCLGNTGKGEGIQPLSYLAYTAANARNAVAALDEVDGRRIGVVGHSFGGKWAMFASCLCDRFACGVWVDPGIVWNEKDPNANYWEPWYLGFDKDLKRQREPGVVAAANPRTGAYKTLVEAGRDMHELHALMAPRPFLVSGGAQDRPVHWLALNHTIAVNKFLGCDRRVAMTMRAGHNPTPESNAQVYAFFEHFLKEARTPQTTAPA